MQRIRLTVVMMSSVLFGCAQPPVRTAAGSVSGYSCAGDDYLEVTNNTGKAAEVYANVGSARGQYIGTLPSDSTRLSLRETSAADKDAEFYVVVEGTEYTSRTEASPVQIARRCARP